MYWRQGLTGTVVGYQEKLDLADIQLRQDPTEQRGSLYVMT